MASSALQTFWSTTAEPLLDQFDEDHFEPYGLQRRTNLFAEQWTWRNVESLAYCDDRGPFALMEFPHMLRLVMNDFWSENPEISGGLLCQGDIGPSENYGADVELFYLPKEWSQDKIDRYQSRNAFHRMRHLQRYPAKTSVIALYAVVSSTKHQGPGERIVIYGPSKKEPYDGFDAIMLKKLVIVCLTKEIIVISLRDLVACLDQGSPGVTGRLSWEDDPDCDEAFARWDFDTQSLEYAHWRRNKLTIPWTPGCEVVLAQALKWLFYTSLEPSVSTPVFVRPYILTHEQEQNLCELGDDRANNSDDEDMDLDDDEEVDDETEEDDCSSDDDCQPQWSQPNMAIRLV